MRLIIFSSIEYTMLSKINIESLTLVGHCTTCFQGIYSQRALTSKWNWAFALQWIVPKDLTALQVSKRSEVIFLSQHHFKKAYNSKHTVNTETKPEKQSKRPQVFFILQIGTCYSANISGIASLHSTLFWMIFN